MQSFLTSPKALPVNAALPSSSPSGFRSRLSPKSLLCPGAGLLEGERIWGQRIGGCAFELTAGGRGLAGGGRGPLVAVFQLHGLHQLLKWARFLPTSGVSWARTSLSRRPSHLYSPSQFRILPPFARSSPDHPWEAFPDFPGLSRPRLARIWPSSYIPSALGFSFRIFMTVVIDCVNAYCLSLPLDGGICVSAAVQAGPTLKHYT